MGFYSLVRRCLSFVWNTFINNHTETKGFCERKENRICGLPDDLLVQILSLVPTKDAAATAVLSKRWRYVWRMLPELEFKDGKGSESVVWFIDKTLELHKAPTLVILTVELIGPSCPVNVDVVGKWVEKAVDLSVKVLDLNLLWDTIEEPIRLPKSLYTCDTLVDLTLSNEIFLDVPSSACLPSLLSLSLYNVVYKDEESLVNLLSSSPVLDYLAVHRHEDDNLTNFTVRVSSLETLFYVWCKTKDLDVDVVDDDVHVDVVDGDVHVGDGDVHDGDGEGSTLKIDCPALTKLRLIDVREGYCLIEDNMPCLSMAYLSFVYNLDYKFLTSLSSLIHLQLFLVKSMEVAFCNNDVKFTRLIELYLSPTDISVDNWLEPLMFFLQNSPKLKTLTIDTEYENLPPSWNQPSSVPECLSCHLETFVWREYEGREDEKQLVQYILANSKCLKKVEISLKATCNNNVVETQKELESMHRISTSSCLLFPSQIEPRYIGESASPLDV